MRIDYQGRCVATNQYAARPRDGAWYCHYLWDGGAGPRMHPYSEAFADARGVRERCDYWYYWQQKGKT